MKILTYKQTNRQAPASRNPVRKYATVRGESGAHYIVTFMRKAGIKRWMCQCQAFIFYFMGRGRHCTHIKMVRRSRA